VSPAAGPAIDPYGRNKPINQAKDCGTDTRT
jgi:hypothetical protein